MIRSELDTSLASGLLAGVYTDVAVQLIIGCPELEVVEYWKRSVVRATLGDDAGLRGGAAELKSTRVSR